MESLAQVSKPNICYENKTGAKRSPSYCVAVIMALFMLFYYYFTLYTQNSAGSWPDVVSISLTFFIDLFIFYQIVKAKLATKKFKRLLFSFLFLLFISFILNLSGVQRLLNLTMVLLGIYVFVKSPVSFKEAKILFWLYTLFVVFILLNTATGKENASLIHKFNPNSGGFLLALLFCSSFVFSFKFKRFRNKLPYLIVCLTSFLLQFIFISRTAMLGIIMFVFATVLWGAFKNCSNKKSAFRSVFILSLLGIVVAFVYSKVLFPMLGYGKITILGKDIFTGRQTIWSFTFDSIKQNFWFGVGSHLNEAQFNEGYYELIMNAHNQPLGIMAACGIFVFFVFYYAIAYFISLLYTDKNIKFNRVPVIFLCVITIMSYFDIYFMSLYNVIPILLVFALMTGSSKIIYNKV